MRRYFNAQIRSKPAGESWRRSSGIGIPGGLTIFRTMGRAVGDRRKLINYWGATIANGKRHTTYQRSVSVTAPRHLSPEGAFFCFRECWLEESELLGRADRLITA